ncbi:MAG: rhodanese-like domain-containing protein [Oscillospiraceae bacterium]|nr:rhodanese-like domain-containing protein [Oscillospiraceae bacterium]
MKKIAVLLLVVLLLAGCGNQEVTNQTEETGGTVAVNGTYKQITQEEAKNLLDTAENFVLLDVRTREEYEDAHIPGAILIPVDEVEERAARELPDKNQLILVYCRSGNRSKTASQVLANMGYTNVQEFGGINDWPYDVE